MFFLKKILLIFEYEIWLYMQFYITITYMKKGKRGQQKIFHKGSKNKTNVFITFFYPLQRFKFNTYKTRNINDFKKHLNSIKWYVLKRSIKTFILVIYNTSFHGSKKIKHYVQRQSTLRIVLFLPKRVVFLNIVELNVNRNLERCMCELQLWNRRKSVLLSKKASFCFGCWSKIWYFSYIVRESDCIWCMTCVTVAD